MALPRVTPSRNEVDEAAHHDRSPFIGRSTILERLEDDRAAATVLIGETGIGKSRLLREYRKRHPETIAVYVACQRAASALPLEPLLNLVRILGRKRVVASELTDSVARAPERDRLSYVRDALERAAAYRPLALQIDDLQWADATTPEAICYCIDRLQDLPLRWHLAAQPISTVADDVDQLRRAGLVDLVHIDGLSIEELREFAFKLGAHGDDASILRLHERTAGNPLYAETLLRPTTDLDDVPPSLRLALRRRVQQLSSTARQLAGFLAVNQSPAMQRDLAELTGLSAGQVSSAVMELDGAEILSHSPSGMALRHELVRDAAYELLGEQTRASHHDRLAKVTTDGWRRAGHLVGAGRGADAARLLLAIGWDRIALESPGEAVAAFDRALRHADMGGEDSMNASAGRACALLDLDGADAGFEAFRDFETRADTVNPRLRAFAFARFAECARRAGADARRFTPILERAVSECAVSSPDLVPGLMCTLGSVLERANDLHGAEAALRRGLMASTAATNPRETIHLRGWLGVVVARQGDVAEGMAIVEDAAAKAAELKLHNELASCCTKLCYLSDMAHDLEKYEHWCRLGLAITEAVGRRSQALLRMNLAYVETDKGRLREALGLCLATIPTLAPDDSIVTQAHCHAAMLYAMLGDFYSAERSVDRAREQRTSTTWKFGTDFVAGIIAEMQGSFESAVALYRQAIRSDAGEVFGLRASAGVVRCALRLHDLPAARESLALMRSWPRSDWSVADALKREAEAYWRLLVDDVALGAADLLAVARDTPDRFRRAQLQLDVAERTGDRALFLGLIDDFEDLGATWIAERARGLARLHGLRPGRRRVRPGFLTDRESAVVNLVAGGKTNVEIGTVLHISSRTVEYHLGNILGKCGLRSRVEIAARVAAGVPLTDAVVAETLA